MRVFGLDDAELRDQQGLLRMRTMPKPVSRARELGRCLPPGLAERTLVVWFMSVLPPITAHSALPRLRGLCDPMGIAFWHSLLRAFPDRTSATAVAIT